MEIQETVELPKIAMPAERNEKDSSQPMTAELGKPLIAVDNIDHRRCALHDTCEHARSFSPWPPVRPQPAEAVRAETFCS